MAKSEAAQIVEIQRELRDVVETTVRDVARSVLANLRDTTPRDTGASAASWRANSRPDGPVVRRSKRGVSRAKAAQAASLAGIAGFTLAQGRINIGSAQPGIEQLNNGSSIKEPAAFVQRGVAKAVAQARVRGLVIRR